MIRSAIESIEIGDVFLDDPTGGFNVLCIIFDDLTFAIPATEEQGMQFLDLPIKSVIDHRFEDADQPRVQPSDGRILLRLSLGKDGHYIMNGTKKAASELAVVLEDLKRADALWASVQKRLEVLVGQDDRGRGEPSEDSVMTSQLPLSQISILGDLGNISQNTEQLRVSRQQAWEEGRQAIESAIEFMDATLDAEAGTLDSEQKSLIDETSPTDYDRVTRETFEANPNDTVKSSQVMQLLDHTRLVKPPHVAIAVPVANLGDYAKQALQLQNEVGTGKVEDQEPSEKEGATITVPTDSMRKDQPTSTQDQPAFTSQVNTSKRKHVSTWVDPGTKDRSKMSQHASAAPKDASKSRLRADSQRPASPPAKPDQTRLKRPRQKVYSSVSKIDTINWNISSEDEFRVVKSKKPSTQQNKKSTARKGVTQTVAQSKADGKAAKARSNSVKASNRPRRQAATKAAAKIANHDDTEEKSHQSDTDVEGSSSSAPEAPEEYTRATNSAPPKSVPGKSARARLKSQSNAASRKIKKNKVDAQGGPASDAIASKDVQPATVSEARVVRAETGQSPKKHELLNDVENLPQHSSDDYDGPTAVGLRSKVLANQTVGADHHHSSDELPENSVDLVHDSYPMDSPQRKTLAEKAKGSFTSKLKLALAGSAMLTPPPTFQPRNTGLDTDVTFVAAINGGRKELGKVPKELTATTSRLLDPSSSAAQPMPSPQKPVTTSQPRYAAQLSRVSINALKSLKKPTIAASKEGLALQLDTTTEKDHERLKKPEESRTAPPEPVYDSHLASGAAAAQLPSKTLEQPRGTTESRRISDTAHRAIAASSKSDSTRDRDHVVEGETLSGVVLQNDEPRTPQHSQRGDARATVLLDDHHNRKAHIIQFSAKGPKNQGTTPQALAAQGSVSNTELPAETEKHQAHKRSRQQDTGMSTPVPKRQRLLEEASVERSDDEGVFEADIIEDEPVQRTEEMPKMLVEQRHENLRNSESPARSTVGQTEMHLVFIKKPQEAANAERLDDIVQVSRAVSSELREEAITDSLAMPVETLQGHPVRAEKIASQLSQSRVTEKGSPLPAKARCQPQPDLHSAGSSPASDNFASTVTGLSEVHHILRPLERVPSCSQPPRLLPQAQSPARISHRLYQSFVQAKSPVPAPARLSNLQRPLASTPSESQPLRSKAKDPLPRPFPNLPRLPRQSKLVSFEDTAEHFHAGNMTEQQDDPNHQSPTATQQSTSSRFIIRRGETVANEGKQHLLDTSSSSAAEGSFEARLHHAGQVEKKTQNQLPLEQPKFQSKEQQKPVLVEEDETLVEAGSGQDEDHQAPNNREAYAQFSKARQGPQSQQKASKEGLKLWRSSLGDPRRRLLDMLVDVANVSTQRHPSLQSSADHGAASDASPPRRRDSYSV